MRGIILRTAFALVAASVLASPAAVAGAHTWDVNEVFSNPDRTVQFIELREMNGGAAETGVGGHPLTSNSHNFTIPSNVAGPTSFRTILFGTAAFAALPGAPTPDHIIAANFLSTAGDTITYSPYDSITYGAGVLPTDGVRSINHSLVSAVNSPQNYAGQTGSVNAGPPPGVPDGTAGSVPMTVTKGDAAGTTLSILWDTATCSGATNHQIVYGSRSQLPAAPGGAFAVDGGACTLGNASPLAWSSVPGASDGSGLLWWVVVATNGTSTEGAWGDDRSGAERVGPGSGGVSGVCGMTAKNVTNACGH